ncbi:MAG: BTAD domain-containing putative transcriptional regulator [Acidimicrobiales bacterium]
MDVEILGPLRVRHEGRDLRLGAAKERTVLGVLLLEHGHVVDVDRLVEEVWPQRPPAEPISSLRVLISRIRRNLAGAGLDDRLRTVPPGYLFGVESTEIDAGRFDAGARAGSARLDAGFPDDAAMMLAEALSLWRGDVLADVELGNASEPSIRRLREARLIAQERRVEAELQLGRHEAVLVELERLVVEHPRREQLWQQLVLALARSGRREDAIRRMATYRDIAADMGRQPTASFVALETAVANRAPELRWTPGGSRDEPLVLARSTALPRPIVELRTTLVGRRAEVARGLSIFDEVVAGASQTILVSGEPGVGKTSLVAELAQQLHERGATVLYGRCDEELHIAYQPFREALQDNLSGLDRTTVDDLLARWPRLARLAGSRAEEGSRVVSSPDAEGERALLFEAIEAWLHHLAARAPVVLVIDDLHWASGPTVSLLRHLAHPHWRPLLCVATFRDTDAAEGSNLREMLASVHRHPNVHRLSLTGLDREGVAALVEARAGHALDAGALRLAGQIHDETGGNPFFVSQLVRHVFEAGADGPLTVGEVGLFQLPDGVRDVIRRRIDRLSVSTQQVLRVAAVIGPLIPFALVTSLWSSDHDALLDSLEEACRARLLVETSGGDYVFAHALVRNTIYGSLSSARRRELHREVGEALGPLPAPIADRAVALAHHFCLGARLGDGARAAAHTLVAGREALAQVAHETALEEFRRGLDVLERFGPADPALAAERVLGVAESCNRTNDHHGRSRAAWSAADAARRAASDELLARAAYWTARFGVVGSLDERVVGLCEEAIERLGPEPSALKSQVMGMLASVRALGGEGEDADPLAREAVAIARAAGDPVALVEALDARFTTLSGTPDVDQRLEVSEEMVAIASQANDLSALGDAYRFRAAARLTRGDRPGFDRDFAAMTALGEEMRDGFLRAISAQWRATVALLDGRFDDVEAYAGEAVELSGQDLNFVNAWAAQLLWLRHEQGRLAEFVPLLEATVHDNPRIVGFRAALAMASAALGRHDEARGLLRDILEGRPTPIPRDWIRTATLTLCAETAALLDDRDAAAALEPELRPYAGQLVLVATGTHCPGAIDRFRGMLAAVLGDFDRAEAYLSSALVLEEQARTPPNAARTRLWYARTLAQVGDPAGIGAELAGEAAATAAALGMRGVEAEAALIAGRARPPEEPGTRHQLAIDLQSS